MLKNDVRERRSDRRYVISAGLEYVVSRDQKRIAVGQGRLVNISRGGILFESTEPIPLEAEIELFVQWPVRVAAAEPIYLRVLGNTVRAQGQYVAARIFRHEFPAAKERGQKLLEDNLLTRDVMLDPEG